MYDDKAKPPTLGAACDGDGDRNMILGCFLIFIFILFI
jgi:phosphoglucomutase